MMADMSKPVSVMEAQIDALKYRADRHRREAEDAKLKAETVDAIRFDLERDLANVRKHAPKEDEG